MQSLQDCIDQNLGIKLFFCFTNFYLSLLLLKQIQKRVKSSIEIARTFATLFVNENLRKQLIKTNSVKDVHLLIKNETENRCRKNFQLANLELKENQLNEMPKFHFSMLKGLRNDLTNVAKFYKSDYLDIFKDRKSQLKALSTTIFLYFTCILPTIAFGSVNDKNTAGMIDARKALIGQFLGGLIFALFR